MSIFSEFSHPIVFAHRGASAHAPENTLAAFRLAAEHGADAIELDAKLSADGQIVVFHDPTLQRTTGATGLLSSQPLSALKELDAGSFFGPQFRGERIPTLAEVFEEVGQRLLINVELTNYSTPKDNLPEAVVELIVRMGLQKRILLSSFYPDNLTRARQALPDIPVGLLAMPGLNGLLSRSALSLKVSPQFLHPNLRDATARLIRSEHKRHRRVHVWTVNRQEDMRRLFADGVDGIFTDDPLLARQTLQNA